MEDQSYNGWKNFETWLVNLHISNDAVLHQDMREVAKAAAEAFPHEHGITRLLAVGEAVKFALSDSIHEELDEARESAAMLLLTDCFHTVLTDVYWSEIAQSLLETE